MDAERIKKIIADYKAAVIKEHEFGLEGDYRKANVQSIRIGTLFEAIIEAGDYAREALLDLVDDDNMNVAAFAATHSLKYNPKRCKAVLKRISKESGMIGFEAKGALKRWKEGDPNFK